MISIRGRSISWILVLTMVFTTLFGNSAMAFADTTTPEPQQPTVAEEVAAEDEVATHNVALTVDGDKWGKAELTYQDEDGKDVTIESVTLEEAKKATEPIGQQLPEGTEVTLKMEPKEGGQIEKWEPSDDLKKTKWTDATEKAEATFTVEDKDVQVDVTFAEIPAVEEDEAVVADKEASKKAEATESTNEKSATQASKKAGRSAVGTSTMSLEQNSEGKYFIDAENGKISGEELYSDFMQMFSNPKPHGNEFKYSTSSWLVTTVGTKVTSDSGKTFEFTNGEEYYVNYHTNSLGWATAKSFTARTYYNITASVDPDFKPDGAGVSVKNAKVYAGGTAELDINYVDGKVAKIYVGDEHVGTASKNGNSYSCSYEPSASTTLTVRYENVKTYEVSSDIQGTGKGTVQLSPSGPQEAGSVVTFTAKPDDNSYVKSISIDGATFTDNGFGSDRSKTGTLTVGTSDVKVTVEFAEKSLTGTETATVGFNGAKTVAEQKAALEKAIIDAVVSSAKVDGANVDLTKLVGNGVTVQFKSTSWVAGDKWCALDEVPGKVFEAYSKFPGVGETAEIKITWNGDANTGKPENSITSTITLKEAREAAKIGGTTAYTEENPLKTSNPDEVTAAVRDVATINGEKPANSNVFEIKRADNQELPSAGEKKELTYNVSVAETADYLAGSGTIKIWVKSDANPATISVKSEHGTVEIKDSNGNPVTGSCYAGELTLTATPDATYFVESVTVNDTPVEGTFAKRVFTGTFAVENNASYDVKVTYGQRTLTAKENPTIDYNFYYDITDKADFVKDELIDKVLVAQGGTAEAGNVKVQIKGKTGAYYDIATTNSVTKVAANVAFAEYNGSGNAVPLRIVWAGNEQYAEVTLDTNVVFNESRTKVPNIAYTGSTFEVDALSEITTDAVADGITHDGTDAGAVSVAFKEGTLPAEGKEGTVTYTVTIAANANYVKTVEDVKVPVKNKAYLTTVTYDDSVAVLKKGDETIKTEDKVVSGEYKFIVTPGTNQYVEGATATNATLGDGSWNKTVYTVPVTITNGETAETSVTLTADIATRVIKGNTLAEGETYTVTYNPSKAWKDQEADVLQRVIETVVDKEASGIPQDTDKLFVTMEIPKLGAQKVTIVWVSENEDKYPTVEAEFDVTFTESRTKAPITLTAPTDTVEIAASLDEVKDKVKTQIPEGVEIDAVTVTGNLPNQGEEGTATVTVTTKANDTYLANSATVEVPVVGKVKNAEVKLTVGEHGELTGILEGSYNAQTIEGITATPDAGYYVDEVKVNGAVLNFEQDTLAFTWNQEIQDGRGQALEEDAPVYNIDVTFAARTIVEKETLGTVTFNRYNKPSTQLDIIKQQILDAVVDSIVPEESGSASDLTVEVWSNGLTFNIPFIGSINVGEGFYALDAGSTGYYYIDSIMDSNATQAKVRVTLPATGKYPAVTKEVTLDLADSRAEAPLNDTSLEEMEFRSAAEVEAAVKAAAEGTTVNPNGLTVKYAIDAETPLPDEVGASTDVTYNVTFAGNETYKAATAKITVNVTRVAYPCTVTADRDAISGGTVKANGTNLRNGAATIDGDSDVTITAKATSKGNAVTGIRVYKVATEGNDTAVDTSEISYDNGTASVTFHADGTNGADSYIVYVDYEQGAIISKADPTITYCWEQQAISAEKLQRMVFDAIYDAENSIPKGVTADTEGVKVEYATVAGSDWFWKEVGKAPSFEFGTITHHFGESGSEKIRITYTDVKYGELTTTVDLKVIDACYNNTVTVVEENDVKGGNVDVSADISPETKNGKYKEKVEYTVTVSPGNGVLDGYPTEAAYVKDIVITDKAGNKVGSAMTFKEAGSFFGISYEEPTAIATFTTASNEDYTVTVTYGTIKYNVTEDAVTLDLYKGGNTYAGVTPTAEGIFKAVIKGADPAYMAEYNADKITVEYSTNNGLSYKAVDDFAGVADGTTVKVRITYNEGTLQYHSVSAFKDVKLKDPRANTEIKTNELPEIVEYQNDETLEETLKEVLAPIVEADGKTLENADIQLKATTPVEENGEYFVDVTLTYDGTSETKPASKTIEKVKVSDLPDTTVVKVVSEHGTVKIDGKKVETEVELLEQSSYDIVATPDKGWAVDSIVVTEAEAEAAAVDNPLELAFAKLAASGELTIGSKKTYTITVNYVEPHFTVDENATMNFRPGIDTPKDEEVFAAAVIEEESIPQELRTAKEGGQLKMQYLAREAGNVTVEIPAIIIGDTVISEARTIEIPLTEKWADLDADIKEVTLDDLKENPTNATLIANYGCHKFGSAGSEKVRFSYTDNQYEVGETTATIELIDNRVATALDINETVTVTYNDYDEATVRSLMTEGKAGILADGTKVEGALNLEDEVTGLDAGTYEINVSFAGDENYKPCEGTFQLVVEKAPVKVNVASGMYRYGELPKTSITTDPAGVNTISMIAGINVAGIGDPDIGKASTDIYLNMPGKLGEFFKGEMSLSDFRNTLKTFSGEAAKLLGIDQEIIDYLLNMIDQIPGIDNSQITIKINKGTPTDIGVYVVGAVTADSNYKTAGNVGYLIIHPDGYKAELAWNIEDDNGLVTLPYVQNGDYDLGATVTSVNEGTVEAAQKKMSYIYFGVDENGEVVIKETTDAQDIGLGAYTQMAYLKDFGNEMYYAKPLIRAMAIVPDLVKIQFPESGAKFAFDGKQHGLTAEAYDKDGGRREDWDKNITYKYVGYDGNDIAIYNSDVPPTNVGVYTVIATYRDDEAKRYGSGIGTMTIQPADASIDVENRTVINNGKPVSSGVTVTPEDCKYITMVAGVDVNGDFTTEGLGAIGGAANIDFPERLDKVLVKLLPEAYGDGVSVNGIIQNTDKIAAALEQAGLDAEAINVIVNFIGQLPQTVLGDAKVTFHDWDEIAPVNTGMYVIGAVTCDPNYKMAADYGYLAIVPDATKAELSFNMTDDNGVITSKIIKQGIFDFGVTATVEGEYSEEANSYVQNLFIGVDKDGNLIKSTTASAEIGLYTQVAYMADTRTDQLYYAAPISRAYAVVAQLADVQFENNTGVSKVLYSGEAHAMKATAFGMDGEELNKDNLTIRYIGYDANDIEIYNSTKAPVNVGTYTVLATYADAEDEVYGMNVGKLLIMPAGASVAVADYSGAYDKKFNFTDLITVEAGESVVTDDKPACISIVRGIEGEGYLSVEGIDFVNGVVVIDFPDRADKYLQKLVPELYEGEGIDLVDVALNETKIREALEQAGFDAEAIDKVMTEVQAAKEAGDVKVRIAELKDVKTVNIGLYLLTAVTCDPNFQIACDTGLVEVYPNELDGEIVYNQELPESNVLELDQAEAFDFGAYIFDKESGKEVTDYNIKHLYYGKTEDGKDYLSEEPPTEVGTYTQITKPLELANNIYILSASRSFSIERITTKVTADMEGGIYNGKAYEVKNIVVKDREGSVLDNDYTVTYTGTLASGDAYESADAPTEAGKYTVTVKVAKTDRYKAAQFEKDFEITKREITVTIADAIRACNATADPEFTATVENEINKGDIEYTLSREEGDKPGTYKINGTWTNKDDNHTVKFVPGTMTYKAHVVVVDKAVDATCTETGLTEGSHCSACNTVLKAQETVNALGHKLGAWEHDDYDHWKTCERCDKPQNKGAHVWDDGVLDAEETKITYTCETCKCEKVKDLAKTTIQATVEDAVYDGKAHGATGITVTAKDATPTYTVKYTGTTAGGSSYESTNAPVAAGKYTVTIKVARTDEYQAAEFTKAFEIKQREIVVTIANVAKCIGKDDPAFTAQITKGNLIGDDQLTYDLTREAGEKVGKEYKIYAENVSVSANYDVKFVTGVFTIDLHNYEKKVVDPTCERHGYTKHTCQTCGYIKYDNYTDALGHDTGAWEHDADNHWKTCARCEKPQEKGAHVWDDGVVNADQTKITYTCETCEYETTKDLAETSILATVEDAYVYDGKAHGATGIKVAAKDAEPEYTVSYTGKTAGGNAYDSAKAPTEAGTYKVTIAVEATKAYQAATFTKDFQITKREITVKIADATRLCYETKDPEFTATVENEINKGDIEYTLSREEGDTAGSYKITGTWTNEDNNHVVNFVEGTMNYKDHKAVTDKAVAATCTETGLTEGSHCGVEGCGKVLKAQETVKALGHKLGVWEHNADNHWQTCERCEKPQNKGAHVWNDGVINEDGTAVVFTCETCKAESVKPLAKTKIAATVERNAVYDGNAHGATDIKVTAKDAEPTYTVSYTGKTASGEAYNDSKAPVVAGEYTVTITVEATKEYQSAEFTRDFQIAKREITVTIANATRHCDETKDPEFTAQITKGSLIGNDKLTYDLAREDGDKLGKGYKIFAKNVSVNANYDVEFVTGVLTFADHDYKTTVVDPTCEKHGYTKHACETCGYTMYDNFTSALGHKLGAWEHDNDNHWKTCSTCEKPQNKGAHVWDDGVINKDKTKVVYTCETCKYETTVDLSKTSILVTVEDAYVYDGKAHGATGIKVTAKDADPEYTISYTGTTASGEAYNSVNAPTEAGTYTVTIKVEATKAHQAAEFTKEFQITKREITVKIADATRTCGATEDPVFTATVENEINKGDIEYTLSREAGDVAGAYKITGTWTNEDNNHVVNFVEGTMVYNDHKAVTDKAVAATCTKSGLTEGSHCGECGTVLKAQDKVAATGHKTGSWKKDANNHWHVCKNCDKVRDKAAHKWGKGVVSSKKSTITYTCKTCGYKKVVKTKQTDFGILSARATKATNTTITVKWTKVKDADGYIIYGSKCGKKTNITKLKKLKTVSAKTTSYKVTKLKKATSYKYRVVAYKNVNGKKVTIATSKVIHQFTTGGKYGNATSVKVNKTKVTLKKGKTFKVKASEVKPKNKKLQQHRAIAFETTNKKVATVTSKGVIKAKGKGTCYVYAYGQNGSYKKIKVTVK